MLKVTLIIGEPNIGRIALEKILKEHSGIEIVCIDETVSSIGKLRSDFVSLPLLQEMTPQSDKKGKPFEFPKSKFHK